jgi:hypothetical protein
VSFTSLTPAAADGTADTDAYLVPPERLPGNKARDVWRAFFNHVDYFLIVCFVAYYATRLAQRRHNRALRAVGGCTAVESRCDPYSLKAPGFNS